MNYKYSKDDERIRKYCVDYIQEVVDKLPKGVELTISQKIHYPIFIEFVALKVYNHAFTDPYSGQSSMEKYLNETAEKYHDLFPELFI